MLRSKEQAFIKKISDDEREASGLFKVTGVSECLPWGQERHLSK